MIEIVINDRLGKKVRIKCKYPFERKVQELSIFLIDLYYTEKIHNILAVIIWQYLFYAYATKHSFGVIIIII
jgi:hypothetical protein